MSHLTEMLHSEYPQLKHLVAFDGAHRTTPYLSDPDARHLTLQKLGISDPCHTTTSS